MKSICKTNDLPFTDESIVEIYKQEYEAGTKNISIINKSLDYSIINNSRNKKIDITIRISMEKAPGKLLENVPPLNKKVLVKIFKDINNSNKDFIKHNMIPHDRTNRENTFISNYKDKNKVKILYVDLGEFLSLKNTKEDYNYNKLFKNQFELISYMAKYKSLESDEEFKCDILNFVRENENENKNITKQEFDKITKRFNSLLNLNQEE